jgi:hypothetical protein
MLRHFTLHGHWKRVELKSTVTILIVAAYSADVQFKKARPPSDITLKCVSGKKMRNAVVSTTYAHLISKQVSHLCNNKVKCEFELTDLIKDHNSTCSSDESTAQLGIMYHCSR